MAPVRHYLLRVMELLCNLFCECFTNSHHGYPSPSTGSPLIPDQAPAHADHSHYHVFISHRGPDVKKTLVDFLHQLLTSRGFTCFVDEHTLKPGENGWSSILSAICSSEVQVIVLSKNFAESTFCLNEVHEIMQLPSKKVLPIFFDVKPSDLCQTNSGPYNLSQYAAHDRSKWATALKELSAYAGFRSDQTNGFQGKLAEKIVFRVAELIIPAPFYVDPSLAHRFCSRADQAEKLLDLGLSTAPEALRVVSLGIVGLADVGRSTIAKLLFNKLHNQFQASSILLDVRNIAKSTIGLLKLQTKLLEDLLKEDPRIFTLDEGLGLLLERLKNVKCLIVIDDIDVEIQQLKNLLVLDHKGHLGRGSRFIFTTRYGQVLQWAPENVKTLTLSSSEEEEAKALTIIYTRMDVYQDFIDHLEESFSMLGLSVSAQDLSTLNGGLERQTKLLLVVLSKSFIASSEFLNELSKLSNSDATIVPIFYSLEPHAVDSFFKVMQSLSTESSEIGESSSMSISNREKWKKIMSNQARHFSVELDKPAPTIERSAFKSLINGVVELLQYKYPQVNVAEYPVGLMVQKHNLEKLISNISDCREKYVGVVGMGGVGKTTLVKSLYNNIHKKFEGSALLLDVREEARRRGLEHLQKTILDKVMGNGKNVVNSVDEGTQLLSDMLAGTNALIILDDVDNVSQVEALIAPLNLGPRSQFIIASRSREILMAAKVEERYIYEVQLLSSKKAKTLFCWHAFLRPDPPDELQKLAQDLIDKCQGLPLSLKVIGAHVYNHTDANYFRDTLVHLEKADHDILRKLRITYDALKPRDEKKAFLDVACFFIGKRVETALRVWEGSGWAAQNILEVLKNRCLVNVDATNGTIGMHDQLRDMGRYIVAEDSRSEDIKPLHTWTHVWDQEDAKKFLEESRRHQDSSIYHIRGLRWHSQEQKQCNADAFLAISDHLQILMLNEVSIRESCRRQCNEIRWLEWHHCKLDVLPSWLWSRKLTVLDLSESHCLKAIWRRPVEDLDSRFDSDSEDIEVPQGILELNLSGCKSLEELPAFDPYLLRLQQLNLSGCSELRGLHSSIGCSTSLEVLDLSGCNHLPSLPREIKGLTSLKKLLLTGCNSLQSLPQTIGQLRNLTEICLDGTRLRELPDSFGELESLERLNLSNCPELKELPDGFCKLVMLSELNLTNCSQLEHLWFQTDSRSTNLPHSTGLTSLKKLLLSGCKSLQSLPQTIGQLRNLTEIWLDGTKLRELPDSFGELEGLDSLNLDNCLELVSLPPSIERLKALKSCLLSNCPKLKELPDGFCKLVMLSELNLANCSQLEHLCFQTNSRSTNLPPSAELGKLKGLEGLGSLQHLNITGCSSLRHVPGLDAVSSLRRLHLCGSRVIPPWNLLELPSIEHVSVFGSEMPKCFRNCMEAEIDGIEHANQVVMTLQVPALDSISRPSCFAIVFCLVSHDQGWSDYAEKYGSHAYSSTFVEGVLVRNRSHVVVDLLYRNRHADCRDQVNVVVLRPECPLLKNAKEGDTIEIRARSMYPAWKITVKQASYLVVNGDSERLKAVLQLISAELRWAALYTAAIESLVQGGRNESLRGLAALDIAGNSELTRVLPISNTERKNIQVEKLDLVWRPNLQMHDARVRTLSSWWPFSVQGGRNESLLGFITEFCHINYFGPLSVFGKMMWFRVLIGRDGDTVCEPPIDVVSHLRVITRKGTIHDTATISHYLGLDLRVMPCSGGQLSHTQLYSHRFVKTSAIRHGLAT